MRSLINILDLSVEEIDKLMDTACDMIADPDKYAEVCKGKKLATLFFEPSTRTRLSFEAAMYEIGGADIGFSSGENTSTVKGETIADTAKIISNYVDVIAMRHPVEGAPLVAAMNADVPVINAGDGGHFHPTQTLADLLTIRRHRGSLSNLTIGYCGDLKYGRTVHSLISALSRYEGIKTVLISPEELELPDYIKNEFLKEGEYEEVRDLEQALPKLDVLYMTRVQKERFEDPEEYERLKDTYVLNAAKMASAGPNMIVLHPLPRVNEIDPDVDEDPRACYFEETFNGKCMRKALMLMLIEDAKRDSVRRLEIPPKAEGVSCPNPKCITKFERGLPQRVKTDAAGIRRCFYCDAEI